MRKFQMLLIASASCFAMPAVAADQLKFGPVPNWVVPRAIPDKAAAGDEAAPILFLLSDQQTRVDPGLTATFAISAFKIQTPDGLQVGNVSLPWDPARQTITVHKLEIHRGGKVMDVLAGQRFTILRREQNLEAAMLDGLLTANIQPEGLQVGDILVLASTTEHSDPVMKGHVEVGYGDWNGLPVTSAHARLSWPETMRLQFRSSGGLAAGYTSARDGRRIFEISAANVQPIIPPQGAPARYGLGRQGEATTFQSWSEVADLMRPLYETASALPKTGPLRDELEKIRAGTQDPKLRAEKALDLVEHRVRYMALLMGQDGYVPATAESTWLRRFGDCKAKSALLLGLLKELGISAEPVLVTVEGGDALAQRLPMIAHFNHVLVRARIAGKTYWLDGTRTGDSKIDTLDTPFYSWGLPVVRGAKLVSIVPDPPAAPMSERLIRIDASEGIFASASMSVDQIFRGDNARMMNAIYLKMTPAQRTEGMRHFWKNEYGFLSADAVEHKFDRDAAEFRMSVRGKAKLEWEDNLFYVPGSSLAYEPNFERTDGPTKDAPFAVEYPSSGKIVTRILLPQSFRTALKNARIPQPLDQQLAGTHYFRAVRVEGDEYVVEVRERALTSEIPHKEAIAATAALKDLNNANIHLRVPRSYIPTKSDLDSLGSQRPATARALTDRANLFIVGSKFEEAVADLDAAVELEPTNLWALANRAMAHIARRDFSKAEPDLAKVEKGAPNNPIYLRARALKAEFQQDFKSAVDYYTRALAADPGDTFAYGHRAKAHAALKNRDLALADSAKALQLNPAWEDLRLLRANLFRAAGDSKSAVQEADLLSTRPGISTWGIVAAAKIYAANGERSKAMALFEQALKMEQASFIYLNRASVRPPSDHAGRANDFDQALKLSPNDPDVLAARAHDLLESREYLKAAKAFEETIRKDPDMAKDLNVYRAVALYRGGKVDEGQAAFSLVRKSAKTAVDFNNLCWSKATANILLESASQDCREALKLAPGTPSYLDSFGMVLLRLGRFDEALAAYNEALIKDRFAEALMGRAMVFARLGERKKAETDAVEARKLDPTIDDTFERYGLRLNDVLANN